MKRLLPALMILALIVGACTRVPDTVLPQEQMARLMADLELADAYATDQRLGQFATDSMRLMLRESVLAKHGINEAKLDTSMRWYGRNLPKLQEVYDRVDSILADSLRALDAQALQASIEASGDTIDLWPLQKSMVLTGGQQFLVFELPADSTWQRGDVIEWQFAVHNNAKLHPIAATLGSDYLNRSRTIDTQSQRIEKGQTQRMRLLLQLDRQKQAGSLFGYILIPIDSSERVFIDSIRLNRTRLVEAEYHQRRYRTRPLDRTHE